MKLEFTFKTVYRPDSDEWHSNGPAITDKDTLNQIENALENRILILEHWHYRGSRAPDRIVITEYIALIDYLKENAIAGDAIHVFDITDAIKDGTELAYGKCPDDKGMVPKKGAY